MRVIGGNKNFTGSKHGVGMFLVDRNFLRPLDCKLDFIELIDIRSECHLLPFDYVTVCEHADQDY